MYRRTREPTGSVLWSLIVVIAANLRALISQGSELVSTRAEWVDPVPKLLVIEIAINLRTKRSLSWHRLNRRTFAHTDTPYNSNGSILPLYRRDSQIQLGFQLSLEKRQFLTAKVARSKPWRQ